MYKRFAAVYDAIYGFKNYAEEAKTLKDIVAKERPSAKTWLDVACGTGAHIKHLQGRYNCVGVDLSNELLDVAREKLPGVALVHGDMRTFALGRTFDVVTCLFGAIGYMTTQVTMHEAIANMANHLAPGGIMLVEPWIDPIEFIPGRYDVMTAEAPTLKVARANTNSKEGNVSVLDFHFLVADKDGVDHFQEVHRLGMYSDEEYVAAFNAAGLNAKRDEKDLIGRGLYRAFHQP